MRRILCLLVAASVLSSGLAAAQPSDECPGEQRGLAMAEGFADTARSQIGFYWEEIDKLASPMQERLSKMAELAPRAQEEVLWHQLDALIGKFSGVLLRYVPAGASGVTVGDLRKAYKTGTTMPGSKYIGFFEELRDQFTLLGGDWEEVGELATRKGMPNTKAYVDTMMELRGLLNRGAELRNVIVGKETELVDLEQRVQRVQGELEACRAQAP